MAYTLVPTELIQDGAVTSAKLDTNIAISGTVSAGGVVTANAGVVIDNITIDGNQIAISTGDLILDAAGDIILDADGTDIVFKDGGTQFGKISNASTHVTIYDGTTLNTTMSGANITFAGTVGSGAITSSGLITATSLDISGDVDIDGTTNLDVVDIDGAVDMASTLAVGGDANFDSGTLFVDVSANSVGIGTTSPSDELTIRGAQFATTTLSIGDNSDRFRIGYLHASGLSSGLAAAQLGSDAYSDLSIAAPSNAASEIKLFTNASSGAPSERMRIDSSGNVGIGVSPSHPLHITKEIAGYQAYFNNDNGSAQGVKVRVKANDSGNFNMLELVSASTGSDVTAMIVRDDGNVGIGTTSPSAALHVSGDSIANTFKLIANTSVSGSDATIFRPADNTMAFSTNGAERMRIDSSGNVGIGGASGGASLQVNRASTSYIDIKSDNSLRMRMYGDSNQAILVSEGVPLIFKYGSTETMRIDSSGNVTKPLTSGFQVTGSSGLVDQSSGGSEALLSDKFNTAGGGGGHNIGGDYNTSTGIYTAPVAGRYLFGYTFRWETASFIMNNYIRTYISINNGRDFSIGHQINGRNEAFTSFMAMSGSAIVSLSAGDTVRVKGGLHGGTGKFYASESSFYGILMS